jgi:hypothetical protein
MRTFLVSVHGRWPQLIVSAGHSLGLQKRDKLQKRLLRERRVREDRNVGRRRCEHPYRDLQAFACGIDDGDRAISPLGPAQDA